MDQHRGSEEFMMNMVKAGLVFSLAFFTMICVGYAHSQSVGDGKEVTSYIGGHWFAGYCRLQVEKAEGGGFTYKARGISRTAFTGRWGAFPGDEVVISVSRCDEQSCATPEREFNYETIVVRFDQVGGELQPVGYMYRDQRAIQVSNKLVQPVSCFPVSRE
ncbi:MAG: hypothetical protein HC902_01745 [Calothrix sp. SM1_5_4]|nr:hypothetical protein [Calothrix sp. SM1_5_4]